MKEDTESDEDDGPKKKKHRGLFNKPLNDGYGSEEDYDEEEDEDENSDDDFEQNAFNN